MSTPTESAHLLVARSLRKAFRGVVAVDDVSLEVGAGEIVGMIGPNGAGKTTVFNLIAGAFAPTRGSIEYDGHSITRTAAYQRCRLGIGRTFQMIHPFASLTLRENLVVAATGAGLNLTHGRARADEIIETMELSAIADKLGATLNAVQGKRLELARALATAPRLILLDEIFSGLNEFEVEQLGNLVRGLPDRGIAVLFIEHNVDAIRQISHRVIAMNAGRIVAEGSPEAVLTDPDVLEMYMGTRVDA